MACERLGDDGHAQLVGVERGDREGDPVEGNRPLLDDVPRPRLADPDAEGPEAARALEAGHGGRGVDVALDDVSAHPGSHRQRPLEVHRVARAEGPERRALEGLAGDVEPEDVRAPSRDHREADAGDADALAAGNVAPARRSFQIQEGAAGLSPEGPNRGRRLDESGEHALDPTPLPARRAGR